MVVPVPKKVITTPYNRRGKYWSCDRDSNGNGRHTGADFAAPAGWKVVAARPGVVRHVNYGKAFGTRQVAVVCADGSEDFYAHMRMRVPNGTRVKAGDKVGEVGASGNVTGAHLHFERHRVAGKWSCANCINPQPSIDYVEAGVSPGKVYLSKLKYGQKDSDSVRRLQETLNGHPLKGGQNLPITGNYGDQTDEEVRLCQQQHGFGDDPAKGSSVGPRQAEHLFAGTGNVVVNDLEPTTPPDPPEPPVSDKKFIYSFSGKPSSTQDIGTSYTAISRSSFTPPADGLLISMLYLNAAHTFDSGINEAGFRVRSVRAPFNGKPADYSGYGDFTPNRNLTKPGEFLLTHVWFEMAEGGRTVHWEIDRASQFGKFTLGTRYTKWVWISSDVLYALGRLLGMSVREVGEAVTEYLATADDIPDEPRTVEL